MAEAPRVFISYSHDSPVHKRWVAEFASKLRHNGVDVILDQWDLSPGDDVTLFMEQGLTRSERVLVICTDEYVRKADAGKGGVGYERMIVTAELVRDLGTKKFIPVIRQASGENKAPKFLGARFYIDIVDESRIEEPFELLLKEIHRVPIVEKPALGKNPFASLPSGEEAPKVIVASGQLSVIPKEFASSSELYATALDLARRGDLIGWRQLVKRSNASTPKVLSAWREKYDQSPPVNVNMLHAAVDEAIAGIADTIVTALVGVESGREELRDQRSVFDDLLNVTGWKGHGATQLVELPRTLGYVYHSLHGALCLNTGQLSLALGLADVKVRKAYEQKLEPIWTQHDLTGWPSSLGGNCSAAWMYLSNASKRWSWLLELFGSEEEYRASLAAYYMALNTQELAEVIAKGKEEILQQPAAQIILNVPVCFAADDQDVNRRACALLTRKPEAVAQLWERVGAKRSDMERLWPTWMRVCAGWLFSVYRDRFHESPGHSELFSKL